MDVVFAEPAKNLQRILQGIEEASAQAAELIVFPECALTGYCYDTGEPGEGNAYGGYACCDQGDGGGGSSDGGDNPWPMKNAVDIDVTDLVRWKLGQNPAYSDFDPDSELTIMVRTDFPEA